MILRILFTTLVIGITSINIYSQETFNINGKILELQQIQSMKNDQRLSYLDEIDNIDQALEYFLWVFHDFVGNTTASQAKFSYALYDKYGDDFCLLIENKIRSTTFNKPLVFEEYVNYDNDLSILISIIPVLMYDKNVQYFFDLRFADFLEKKLVEWVDYQGSIDRIVKSGTNTVNRIRYGNSSGPYGYTTDENLRSYYDELIKSGRLAE
jgi:hypothetical protein